MEQVLKRREQRFGPERRVKKRRDFLAIQGGRKVRTDNLLIAYSYRTQPPVPEIAEVGSSGESTAESPTKALEPRLGITVTKKVDKLAVARNLMKRRIREVFRRVRWQIRPGADIVVICLEGSSGVAYQQLYREILWALNRTGLIEPRESKTRRHR